MSSVYKVRRAWGSLCLGLFPTVNSNMPVRYNGCGSYLDTSIGKVTELVHVLDCKSGYVGSSPTLTSKLAQ